MLIGNITDIFRIKEVCTITKKYFTQNVVEKCLTHFGHVPDMLLRNVSEMLQMKRF